MTASLQQASVDDGVSEFDIMLEHALEALRVEVAALVA